MPPHSRGSPVQNRRVNARTKSTPNLAAGSKALEPFPPIPEPSTSKGAPLVKTQSPVKTNATTNKVLALSTKLPGKQTTWPPAPLPLTKASLDGAQQALKQPTTFLPGAPSEQASSPEAETSYLEDHNFASIPEASDSASASSSSDQDNDNDNDGGLLSPLPDNLRRPLYSYTTRSHSSLGLPQHEHSRPHSVHALAPPFYNRPPTPLPPSPSLTSLLRPLPFSALPSRQTTPDSSDTEAPSALAGIIPNGPSTGTSSTAAVVAHSARTATTVPRASPKVPTYEYYGFVLHIGSTLAFAMYLLWSYLPTPFLHQLGIYYYPDRWWSLALPAWLVMVVVYIFVALASYNTGYLTLGMRDLGCLVDEKAMVAVVDERGRIVRQRGKIGGAAGAKEGAAAAGTTAANGTRMQGEAGIKAKGHGRRISTHLEMKQQIGAWAKGEAVGGSNSNGKKKADPELDWKCLWNEGTDAVMDVPLGGVCEILYGSERESDDSDEDEYYG